MFQPATTRLKKLKKFAVSLCYKDLATETYSELISINTWAAVDCSVILAAEGTAITSKRSKTVPAFATAFRNPQNSKASRAAVKFENLMMTHSGPSPTQ